MAKDIKQILYESSFNFEKFNDKGWFYSEKDITSMKKMLEEFK